MRRTLAGSGTTVGLGGVKFDPFPAGEMPTECGIGL